MWADAWSLALLIPLALFLLLLYLRLSCCNARSPAQPLPPAAAPYTLEATTLDSFPTELLHFAGSPASPLHLLILPGNPGSPYFYLDFCAALHQASQQRLHITIACHACHSAGSTGPLGAPPQFYDLAAQVRHKLAIARELLQRRRCSLVLLGHSVGAHMCLELMRTLPEAAVPRTLLLFPTLLHIGASPNGVAMLPLFRAGRWALGAAALALGALPLALQRAAARARLPPAATPATLAAALTLIHPVVAVNALWLALTEMRDIGPLDAAHCARVGARAVCLFGPADAWNRPGDHSLVAQALGPQARVHLCSEGHPHGFVVHFKSASLVAQQCWGWVKDLLED